MLIKEMKPGEEYEFHGVKVRVLRVRGPRVKLGFVGPDGKVTEVDLWPRDIDICPPIGKDGD